MSLRKIREHSGLTQVQLSNATGLTQAAIAYYESGTRQPSFKAALKLADALGCSEWEILPRKYFPKEIRELLIVLHDQPSRRAKILAEIKKIISVNHGKKK